jgi:predicted pyridoxine 5'-phosphate oxidase superfamily flavin-nucleotide-binding protein
MNTELQARAREALQRTDIMALATINEDGAP